MEQNWIDPIAMVEIKVKAENGRYTPCPCYVTVSYRKFEEDTASSHKHKYNGLRKAIEALAGELGAIDFRDNPDTIEFYFTLPSSTIPEIEAEVNKRKAEILTPLNKNRPEAFLYDSYYLRVSRVKNA